MFCQNLTNIRLTIQIKTLPLSHDRSNSHIPKNVIVYEHFVDIVRTFTRRCTLQRIMGYHVCDKGNLKDASYLLRFGNVIVTVAIVFVQIYYDDLTLVFEICTGVN